MVVMAYTFNPSIWETEGEALVYRVSSQIARTTQRNLKKPLKKTKNKINKQNK